MENEKKPSRLGVRLSAVMLAVLLVVCMAVPVFAVSANIAGYPLVTFPDSATFSFAVESRSNLFAYYTFDDVSPHITTDHFYSSFYNRYYYIPPADRENRPYITVLRKGTTSYFVAVTPTEPYADNYLYFDNTSNLGCVYWSVGNSGLYDRKTEVGAFVPVSYDEIILCNYDLKDKNGEVVKSKGTFYWYLNFTSGGTSVDYYTADSSGDFVWSAVNADSVRMSSAARPVYSSMDIYDDFGNLYVARTESLLSNVSFGLTVVLDWVGATVSALFTGSLSGLLPLMAVPVAITLLIVVFVVIKRSIWGA